MSHNRSIHLFWFVFVFEFFLFHVCQMSIINCLSRLLCYSITKFNAAKIISIVSRSHWTQSAFIWVFSLSLSDCEFCFGSGWIRLITPTALSLSTQNSCNNLKFNFNHEYSMIFSLSLSPSLSTLVGHECCSKWHSIQTIKPSMIISIFFVHF